jgi:hypothetical protein
MMPLQPERSFVRLRSDDPKHTDREPCLFDGLAPHSFVKVPVLISG